MRINELFSKDVTRDIPPVVYFHEQAPAKLAEEVGEYIITGGYPPGVGRCAGDHDPWVRAVMKGARHHVGHIGDGHRNHC
jgi:hypothetical protein